MAKARKLEAWLDTVLLSYNLLPMNAATFRKWARLRHRRFGTLIEDAMIAATAVVHRLMVVTRNVRDFEQFGVPVLNPLESEKGLLRSAAHEQRYPRPASSRHNDSRPQCLEPLNNKRLECRTWDNEPPPMVSVRESREILRRSAAPDE